MTASGLSAKCTHPSCGIGHCTTNFFTVPPGIKSMDGSAWGGITKQDLVAG